jgi:(heptosyl)LPS beta-1,4-glucosyltransferase
MLLNPVKISAVILTFNEEKNIERCLDSLVGVVDEIIVMDSFSTDYTEKICLRYSVSFIQRKWEGYAQAKNYGNSLAENDIILSIDADEALSKELQNDIIERKKSGFTGCFRVKRLNNYCGKWIKHCGWYPDKKIRVFDKKRTAWKGDFVHETLEISKEEKI